MKTILLATDLAGETDRALERAIRLASTMEATLHILHVCPPDSFSGGTKQERTAKQEAEAKLKKYLSGNQELTRLHPVIAVEENREPFVEITNLAEKVNAKLIVMGMHGKSKLRDRFVGTTIEKVIRKGARPVLMVKDKPLEEYANPLIGTDFSADSSQALQVVLELAPKGFLHLVHICDIPDNYISDKISHYTGDTIATSARAMLETFVQGHRNSLEQFADQLQNMQYRVVQGKFLAGLTREAAAVKADLIAIGVHPQASLLPYRVGGKARDILTNPPCDVLVTNRV